MGFEVRKLRKYYVGGRDALATHSFELGRAQLKGSLALIESCREGSINPVTQVVDRLALHYSESSKGVFNVRPLSRSEIDERESLFEETGVWAGRQWVILHRSDVESVVGHAKKTRVLGVLRSVFASDEFLFPMLLFAGSKEMKSHVGRHSMRYRNSFPSIVGLQSLGEAQDSSALFARKLSQEAFFALKQQGFEQAW